MEPINKDARQNLSRSETKQTASTNQSLSDGGTVDYKIIIQTYQSLSMDKKNEYIDLYLKMARKSPLCFVTIDQHIEIYNSIGIPINTPVPAKFRQDADINDGATHDQSIKSDVKQTKDVSAAPNNVVTIEGCQKRKESDAAGESNAKKPKLQQQQLRNRCNTQFYPKSPSLHEGKTKTKNLSKKN